MKISELNDDQKGHLAFLLERHTHCGYGTSGRIARGEFGDDEIVDVFTKADKSKRSARHFAKKVEQFVLDPRKKMLATAKTVVYSDLIISIRQRAPDLSFAESIELYEFIAQGLKSMIGTLKMLDEPKDPIPAE